MNLHAPDAERSILGSLFLDNRLINAAELTPEEFFENSNRVIYRGMLDQWAEAQPFDAVTIASKLNGQLDSVGGIAYLASLVDGAVADPGIIKVHCKTVREFSNLRQLARLGEELNRESLGLGADPKRLIEKAQNRLRSLQQASETDPANAQLRAVSAQELAGMDIKQRENILDPVLPEQGLAMLVAPRGAGKTYLAMGAGIAVATGGRFLKWSAPRARSVLYVDGELPAKVVQERLAMISRMMSAPVSDRLKVITPDLQSRPMPDIATQQGQDLIEPHLAGRDFVILDNLSALVRSGKENEGEGWLPVQGWLLALRRRGITTLLLHHTGKNGSQRGTSRREDLLDTVISLKHPSDYEHSEGLRVEVHFEKTRGMLGDDAKPFEVKLASDGWKVRELEDCKAERAAELFAAGLTVRDVADELEISRSWAGKLRQKWSSNGGGNVQ